MKQKHFYAEIKQFECDFDGKIWNTKAKLNDHMQSHLPKVNCKICNAELTVA